MTERMLSTIDNPYNPWTQFNEWYSYDESSGYQTIAYLARITKTSDDLSDADQSVANEDAIDEALEENVTGIYIAVPKPS